MDNTQFTLYMIVNCLVAVGTIGAVIVALFGKRLFPPQLEITMDTPLGELTRWKQDGKDMCARFYHVRVKNNRRWSPATNVSLHLIGVEEERSDYKLYLDWTGDVQLRWKHANHHPQPNNVGKSVEYDLVSINGDRFLSLHPIAAASNLNKVRNDKCRFRVWLQARSTEADSRIVKLEISWDGTWTELNEEMAKHLIVDKPTAALLPSP